MIPAHGLGTMIRLLLFYGGYQSIHVHLWWGLRQLEARESGIDMTRSTIEGSYTSRDELNEGIKE